MEIIISGGGMRVDDAVSGRLHDGTWVRCLLCAGDMSSFKRLLFATAD